MRNILSIDSMLAGVLASACLFCTSLSGGVAFHSKRGTASQSHRPEVESAPRSHVMGLLDILPEPGPRLHLIPLDIFESAAVEDITNRGVVSGTYGPDSAGKYHSFIYFNGYATTIDHPGDDITFVAANTDSGVLFGNWGSETTQHAGFYNLATNTWTALPDVPGKPVNIGWRTNDAGIAVGSACEGSIIFGFGNCIAWTWNGNSYTFYTAPGASGVGTVAQGINNQNEIVGYYMTNNGPFDFHSYRLDRNGFARFDLPGAANSVAYDINNSGQVLMLASLRGDNDFFQPAIWDKGMTLPLRPFPDQTEVHTLYTGMNDKGDFVGLWFDQDNNLHNFIALYY